MNLVADLLACLRFFSRLPLPETRHEPVRLVDAVAMVPVAGAIIGGLAALVLMTAGGLGLPPLVAATLTVGTLVALTGALHEDGLADCADGFGGGRNRARKLEIMRDSRIGTFGACAVALSLLLRVTALADTAAHATDVSALALIIAAATSRTASLLPLALLRPARSDGLGAGAARPQPARLWTAVAIMIGLGVAVGLLGANPARVASAIALAFIVALTMCALAWRQIGGQTGDVAGAAQQLAEIAVLLAFAAR